MVIDIGNNKGDDACAQKGEDNKKNHIVSSNLIETVNW